jgi:hypothetical protein
MSYTLIERREITSNASSISFDNIPQFYTDLVITSSLRANNDPDGATYGIAGLSINGSTANITQRFLSGSGSGPAFSGSSSAINVVTPGSTNTANIFGNFAVYIPNYTGSAAKSISIDNVIENNATVSYQTFFAGLWNSSSAINSFAFTAGGAGNFLAGSSISLYGINRQQAIGAPKAVGGAISFANGHWYHTFTGSGTFFTQQDIDVDALVVGGGAGGGRAFGGGGGAGGLLYSPAIKLFKNSQNQITVGSGGLGATSSGVDGNSGTPTTFAGLTAFGGGGGASDTRNGVSGASGGGGARSSSGSGGSATPSGQGNPGGGWVNRSPADSNSGAGGGGAGAAGQSNPASQGGAGGNGVNIYSSWASATLTGVSGFYAGGGGGGSFNGATNAGAGGLGGGGNGGFGISGSDGLSNTGGGGGGGGGNISFNGGNGGSGIVIIRYKA